MIYRSISLRGRRLKGKENRESRAQILFPFLFERQPRRLPFNKSVSPGKLLTHLKMYLENLRVRFFTNIQDQIKNPDHEDFSSRKETMYPKKGLFLLSISIETTHNIDAYRRKKTTRPMTLLQVC